ncbi:MAG: hypothetical protein APR63_06205 [Desulfuromonas sp. SDB]|nr:MAG: hypothetical protein APR63_06205 [Desulfuromonas sp. SDB]
MILQGKFRFNLSDIKTAKVRTQGKNATSGSVFVPIEWANKNVIVLLADEGGFEIEECGENSDN